MKPWRTWLARLGVFGALAIVSGCGGGDIPDPRAGRRGGGHSPMRRRPSWPRPRPSNVAAAMPRPQRPRPRRPRPRRPPPAQAPAPRPSRRAPAAGRRRAAPDRDSATAEMLAMANKEPPAPRPPAGDAAPGGRTRRRGSRAGRRPPDMGPGGGMGPANMGPAPAWRGHESQPDAGGHAGPDAAADAEQGMQGSMQEPDAWQPGGRGGRDACRRRRPGHGGCGNAKAPDFRTPKGPSKRSSMPSRPATSTA